MVKLNNNFVKDTLRDRYFRARKEELEFLIDKKTGKIKDNISEPINACLLCYNEQRKLLFRKMGFDFYKCTNCGFIYSSPQLKEEVIFSFYEKSSYDLWIDVLLSEKNQEYDKKKYIYGLKKIERFVSPGSLLDIGSSIGMFLLFAKERRWNAIGLELNEKAIDYARNTLKVQVYKKLLKDVDFEPNSFDAITLWGVIEHFKQPREELIRINRLLKKGGILLIFCPNIDSLVCRILHEKAATFDGGVHTGYFTFKTLKYLLKQTGFLVVYRESFQPDLISILRYLDYNEPYSDIIDNKTVGIQAILSKKLLKQIEKFVLENHLGYKMMVLAKKM